MTPALRQIFEVFPRDGRCLAPLGICVDGIVVGQGVNAVDYSTGRVEGGLEEQARTCLERMRELVERAGAGLDEIARAVCYVTRAEEREPVYALWDALFPSASDRPAFKVLTGALPRGERVRLDVLAVLRGRRRRVDIPGVEARDPTVVIGDWLFTSRLHPINPETLDVPGGLQSQLRQGVLNARRLLTLAGQARQLVQVTAFGRDDAYVPGATEALQGIFAGSQERPALNVLQSWVRSGSEAMIEAIALQPRDSREPPEFRELYLEPGSCNRADGFRYGPFVFAAGLGPATSGAESLSPEAEDQIRAALDSMDRLLALAGCTRKEVARVTFFMRDLAERPALNAVWQDWFPDPQDRPPHTYVPAALAPGQAIALQVIALAGAQRRVLAVPGVEHGDPMSLAAVTGNLLMSSRIFGGAGGTSQDVNEHTAGCFETAKALLAAGGKAGLQQVTAFVSSPDFRASVEQHLDASLEATGVTPRLDVLETDLGRRLLLPRLQLTALVEPE